MPMALPCLAAVCGSTYSKDLGFYANVNDVTDVSSFFNVTTTPSGWKASHARFLRALRAVGRLAPLKGARPYALTPVVCHDLRLACARSSGARSAGRLHAPKAGCTSDELRRLSYYLLAFFVFTGLGKNVRRVSWGPNNS